MEEKILAIEEAKGLVAHVQATRHSTLSNESALIFALKQLLIEKSLRDEYVTFLRKAGVEIALRTLSREFEDQVRKEGLSDLSFDQLEELAVHPIALSRIAQLIDCDPSDYWLLVMNERCQRYLDGSLQSWIEQSSGFFKEAAKANSEHAPPSALFTSKWVRFPDGTYSEGTWVSGCILKMNERAKQQWLDRLTAKLLFAFKKLENEIDCNNLAFVCFGLPIQAIGQHLSDFLRKRFGYDISVFPVTGFEFPSIAVGPEGGLASKSVVIVTDVVRDGGLINRIADATGCEPNRVRALSFVDTSQGHDVGIGHQSVWKAERLVRTAHDAINRVVDDPEAIKDFDPYYCDVFDRSLTKPEKKDIVMKRLGVLGKSIRQIERDFKKEIVCCDRVFNNKLFPLYIDFANSFKLSESPGRILSEQSSRFTSLNRAQGKKGFVHIGSPQSRIWAQILAKKFGGVVIELDSTGRAPLLDPSALSHFSTLDHLFFVDIAARSGETLSSFLSQLKSLNDVSTNALFVLEGISQERKRILEKNFNVSIESLYYFNNWPGVYPVKTVSRFEKTMDACHAEMNGNEPIVQAWINHSATILNELRTDSAKENEHLSWLPTEIMESIESGNASWIRQRCEWIKKNAWLLADDGIASKCLWCSFIAFCGSICPHRHKKAWQHTCDLLHLDCWKELPAGKENKTRQQKVQARLALASKMLQVATALQNVNAPPTYDELSRSSRVKEYEAEFASAM